IIVSVPRITPENENSPEPPPKSTPRLDAFRGQSLAGCGIIGRAENIIVLIILGALLQLVGLVGCVLPWLAGPPFNFIGLILLSIAKGWKPFSPTFLVIMGGLSAGKEKSGAPRPGWGVFVGMMAAMAVKLIVSGIMTFYFIRALL